MIVRIRFRLGAANRRFAAALSAVLAPSAFASGLLGVWRLTQDLDPSTHFPIDHGLFSHWQVWIALAGLCWTAASALNRVVRTPHAEP